MTVFVDDRVQAMRQALADLLESSNAARNAHFTGLFDAGDDVLTVSVAEGSGEVRADQATDPDFTITGAPADWELYFAERPVSHASLVGMLTNAEVSAGQLPTSLTATGDLEKLYANLPIYNRLFENAATRKGANR